MLSGFELRSRTGDFRSRQRFGSFELQAVSIPPMVDDSRNLAARAVTNHKAGAKSNNKVSTVFVEVEREGSGVICRPHSAV